MPECNHCFRFEFQDGPLRCDKCGQEALVCPVPSAKLADMRDASEAGEWNAAWLWHRLDRDEQAQAGLLPYFEGMVAKLKQKRSAKQVLDIQRTIESCKREPKRAQANGSGKQADLDALLADVNLLL